MSVVVKICGLTSSQDAEAVAAAGADAIGMVFYAPSSRAVSLPQAAEISRSIPPGIVRVGVFVDAAPEFVQAALSQCELNLLQFHGHEDPDYCRQFGVMTMKAFRVRDAASLEPLADYFTEAFLLDTYSADKLGGTGDRFDWALAREARNFGKPIFLAGGLTPGNVAEAVRAAQPYAVDVSSGVESSPGKKDLEKVKGFIRVS